MPRGRSPVLSAVLLLLILILPSTRAEAQQDQKLSVIVPSLYLQSGIESVEVFILLFNPTDAQIDALFADIETTLRGTAGTMNQLIGAQVSSFPLGSSAGGFSWTFDPALGTFSRVSPSFGPVFSERALTIGRRRLNVGINYQRATFDSLEGRDLRDGEIKYYVGVEDVVPNFDVFFEDSLDLRLTSDTVGLFATYGVTDRLDLGIAIPIMSVDMEATLTSRLGTSDGVDNDDPTIYAASGSASGIGDIVIRAKYAFLKRQGGGLAAGVDWRLPTGDEEELLGIAGAQGKFYLAASSAYGRLSPHFNVGFTVSGDTAAARSLETAVFDPPDEWNYAGGIDVAVTDRLTVVGDIVGRTLRDRDVPDYDLKLELVPSRFGSQFQQFEARSGSLNMLLGSAGVKFNPFGRGLVSFNLLFPLNDAGLQDKLTWVGGFEWSF